MICDFHVHTHMSADSEANIEHVIERAVSLNMTHLCITDHHDIDFENGEFLLDPKAYGQLLLSYRERYRDKIRLLIGVELGLQPHIRKEADAFLAAFPFDFVIGSSHVIDGIDPYYEDIWNRHTTEEVMNLYFQNILDNLSVHDEFDVYGHIDYAIRYAKEKDRDYSYDKYSDILDRILKKIISMGKGIEINTAGLREGLRSTNPCLDIIKQYRKFGGEIITVGSDAHEADDVGADFTAARKLLMEAGFSDYYIFTERKALALPL